MIFEQIPIGGDRNFAYLVGDEQAGEAAAVDVGYNPQRITERLHDLGVKLKCVIATHSHYDHTGSIPALTEQSGAPFAAYKSVPDAEWALDHGDTIEVGAVTIKPIHCPGHSPDSIALLVNDEKLISGDELFVGKIGGTSSESHAREQYDSLHERLMTLDDNIEVWPGHDVGVKPQSTIGDERRNNPFLQQPGFEEFLHLKQNWATYKQEHGID